MEKKQKKRAASNGTKTNANTIAARVRAAKAIELRMEGSTFAEIAKDVGYKSPQAAFDAVKRALNQIVREPAEELIRLDLERLDKLWAVPYMNAQAGDPIALASCIKIMERRAKILGLDAPARNEHSGKDGGPIQSQVVTEFVLAPFVVGG